MKKVLMWLLWASFWWTLPATEPVPKAIPSMRPTPGAPCNVLAMLAKLGKRTAFIGKVGDDQFGHLLRQVGLKRVSPWIAW